MEQVEQRSLAYHSSATSRGIWRLLTALALSRVFSLLAGKTTTLSMLCGMTPPSSGDAKVFGQSILTSMPSIRSTLGVCPQHNILFGLLTVKEHLELYAVIKGVPRSDVQAAVQDMVAQVGLQDKLNVKSAALSGGMQRKLSVGIALIGDSRIVFLVRTLRTAFLLCVSCRVALQGVPH